MTAYTNPFTVETWRVTLEHYDRSGEFVVGFPKNRESYARSRVKPGDLLVCYVSGVKKISGILRIEEYRGHDSTLIWQSGDGYPIRFKVTPVYLIRDLDLAMDFDNVYPLTATYKKKREVNESTKHWGYLFVGSLKPVPEGDFEVYESLLKKKSKDNNSAKSVPSITPNPKSERTPDSVGSIEDNMVWLKNMYEKGFFSESVFNRKVEALIDRRLGL